jgi:hypothetical protein
MRRLVTVLMLLAGCGGRADPPSPDAVQPRPPGLAGQSVMVLPAQPAPGQVPEASTPGGAAEAVAGLDAAIGAALARTAPGIGWVHAPEVERAAARNPALEIRPRQLAVGSFHAAHVNNIGDPLFGDLRTLAAILNARWALLPVAAGYVPNDAGPGRVEVAVALIDTSGGRVVWYGVVAGEPGPRGPDAALSAAEALARLFQQ